VTKQKQKQYYKVVSHTGRSRVSTWADGSALVRYKKNRFVEAPAGGLLVFDDYEFASLYCGDNTGDEIWEVTVKEPVELPPNCLRCVNDIESVKYFWNRIWSSIMSSPEKWPKGTAAFRYVRLDRQVR